MAHILKGTKISAERGEENQGKEGERKVYIQPVAALTQLAAAYAPTLDAPPSWSLHPLPSTHRNNNFVCLTLFLFILPGSSFLMFE